MTFMQRQGCAQGILSGRGLVGNGADPKRQVRFPQAPDVYFGIREPSTGGYIHTHTDAGGVGGASSGLWACLLYNNILKGADDAKKY